MLVVDVDALRLVDALDLGDEVELGLGPVADPQQVGGVQRALLELRPGLDPVAVLDEQAGPGLELVRVLLALGVGDRDADLLVGLLDRHLAVDLGHLGHALRLARLEQLDHARQTLGDVEAGDAAGVEGPHRQLRARLTDRLGGDDPHRVAELDHRARRQGPAVAGLAHAGLELALEHRADGHRDLLVAERLGDLLELRHVDLLAALQQLATALGRELLRRDPADQVRVELALVVAQRRLDEVLRLAVVRADDHVLSDVDQTPGQITRVGRPQRRVGEALAGAVGRDEVLEHRQALHEVGLDRALDDLALRIRHQAAHPGELADLLERSARSRVGHHEDRVELVEVVLHRLGDLVGGPVPEHPRAAPCGPPRRAGRRRTGPRSR